MWAIRINKPPNLGIIVPALQVVHFDLFVEIITSVAERVDICNIYAIGQLCAGNNTDVGAPGIVAVCTDNRAVLIGNANDVALQVLLEVIGHIVVDDAADGILIIVDGDQCVTAPLLTQDLGAIQQVVMGDAVHRLTGTNTVGAVGNSFATKIITV